MPSPIQLNGENAQNATLVAIALNDPATLEAIDAELRRRLPELEAVSRRLKQAEIITEEIRELRVNI